MCKIRRYNGSIKRGSNCLYKDIRVMTLHSFVMIDLDMCLYSNILIN